jgi:hypothetical protein
MKDIQTIFNDNSSGTLHIHDIPDKCPFCHHAIDPIHQFAFCDRDKWELKNCLQIIFRCPKKDCRNLFIANYKSQNQNCNNFTFQYSQPVKKQGRDFTDTIKQISSNFCEIYNQALSAEEDGLLEICGVGYRKALEFLVKDYLIKNNADREMEIKKKFLGNCIEQDISNDNIKTMAKRAAWLGNDETHYLRKWEGKDLNDLKKLIDATLYWIEMEKLTADTEIEMPED